MPSFSRILLDDNEDRSPDRRDEDDGLTQFGAGFQSGIKQTQALLGGGLPALIQSAMGDDEDAVEYLNYYNDKMQEAAEIGGDFQRIEDIDGARDAVQWLSYTIGNALPSIGTSILGGGFGGAIAQYGAKKFLKNTVEREVKEKAGKAFEKAMVKRELNRRTQKARKFGQVAGAVGTSTGMNAGETFANVYEESGGIQDPAVALATGLAAGSLDALAPLSILKKVLPDNMSEPFKELMADRLLRNKGMVKRAFIEGVRTGGIEGATEAAQELLQAAAVGMFNDPQSGYKSYGESFFQALNDPTEQQRSQYLNAFAAGIVGGGAIGSLSGAAYKPRSGPKTEERQQSEMPDSEGKMPVETPQSEELEAQQAGFDSYVEYMDAYEGMAAINRGASIEAVQGVIPDQFYLGQDLTPEQDAELEAEAGRINRDFNPQLKNLVGQVIGQGDAEGVLRQDDDGRFFVRDFVTGEEVTIQTTEQGGDQTTQEIGVEQRDNTVEMERDSRVRFNAEDQTFTSPDRGDKPFRYIRTNYGQDGEVESVTAEVLEGSTAGEERVFQKRMARQIEDARLQAEGATALQDTRETLSQAPTQQDVRGNLADRAQEGQPQVLQPTDFTPQRDEVPPPAPAVIGDTPEIDIADRIATNLASALGDAIRAITNPQAQTQQEAPQPSRPARIEGVTDEQLAEIDRRAEEFPVQGRETEGMEKAIRQNFGDEAGDRFAKRIQERLDEAVAERLRREERRPDSIEGVSQEQLADIDRRAEEMPVQGYDTEFMEETIRRNFGDEAGDRFANRIQERLNEALAARQASRGRVIEAGNTRAVIDTDDPQAADTLEQQLTETENRRQQQLRELDRQVESARQPDDDRMGATDVQNMLDDRMGSADVQGMLQDDDRMGASDVQGMLEADDRMGAQDVRNMLDDDTPMMRQDSAPRGATRRPLVTDEELNTVIDRVVGGNQEARSLINFVDRFDQLPAELQEAARQQGADESDVDAVSHKGQIYIVKSRMESGSRLERALLHEGTHGGIEQMFSDEGVSKSLNRMFNAMGGQRGFDRIVGELGITDQLALYEEGTRQARYSKETRNYIMVSEMLAYTGEEGGKTLKSRIREVIGAIRDWLRRNGFAKLATLRASDIAFIAKNARENYFNNNQARQDGQPLFSVVKDRAARDLMGLYSNAEQLIIDRGDKVFQTTKKNPEGRIKGNRILSFLTGSGLKKEEAKYSKIKQFLTDPLSMNNDDQVKTFYLNRVHDLIHEQIRGAGKERTAYEKAAKFIPLIEDYFSNFDPSDSRPEVTKIKIEDLKDRLFLLSEESGTRSPMSNTGTVTEADLRARSLMGDINNILSRLDISQLAEMSGRPADTFTKQEIIEYFQDSAPDLSESIETSGRRAGEIIFANRTYLTDFRNYEHLWDDIHYSMRQNDWDEAGAYTVLRHLVNRHGEEIKDFLQQQFGVDEFELNIPSLEQLYDLRGIDMYQNLSIAFSDELNALAWEVAENDYMLDPLFDMDVYVADAEGRAGEVIGQVMGSEATGLVGTTSDGKEVHDVLYDLDDAKEAFEQYTIEQGMGEIFDRRDTQFFGHMRIDENDIDEYREKVVTLQSNRLSPNKEFTGGHFQSNTLFNVIITVRDTVLGKTLAIEENQSDWHNEIRETGSPFDEVTERSLEEQLASFDTETAISDFANDLESFAEASDAATGRTSPIDRSGFETATRKLTAFEEGIGKYLTNRGLRIFLRNMARASDPEQVFNTLDALKESFKEMGIGVDADSIQSGTNRFDPAYFVGGENYDTSPEAVREFLDRVYDVSSYIYRGYEDQFRSVMGYSPILEPKTEKQKQALAAYEKFIETSSRFNRIRDDREDVRNKLRRLRNAPPDSPFRNDTYLDVSAKGVLRDAVMEGATAVAFSNAQRLIERWDRQYEKGYRFIYDNKMPAIFERLTGEKPLMMAPDNTLISDDDALWGTDPDTGKRVYTGNALWLVKIPPEVAQQIREDGMPMFRRVTGQTNTHEEAANKGELMNGGLSSNEYTLDDETRGEMFIRKIQDKYNVLKKFEEGAAEFLGLKELPDHLRAYIGETLHSGRIATDLDNLEKDFVAPLAKIIKDNEIDIDDFGLYLIAKHAEERNRYIASINEAMPDGGSGMLTEDAKRVISELESPSFQRAAQVVYDMLAKNRERMAEFGLVDDNTIDTWNEQYQFYVPLKGFASTSEDGGQTATPPRRALGAGFNVSGKEVFRALGRQSTAENPALFAIADSEEKISRARRSEPARQFLALADELTESGSQQLKVYRPNDEYPTMLQRDAAGKVQSVRMRPQDMRTATRVNGDKRFLTVKEDGNEVFIEIQNDALNRAMHNAGAENYQGLNNFLGSTANFMRKFQNFRRNMLINWNPSWFLINPLRDLQTGIMYNLAEESKDGGMTEGKSLTGDILRRYLPAYGAYYKNLRGNKADNEYDDYYTEYTEAGAPTGLTLTKDIEEQRSRLFAMVTDGPLKSAGKQGLREIEHLNTASENAIRFATYVSARESGVSVQKAANLAKNLTVNFNRKGEISDGLNLFYLFFNAAVQGTANIAQAMTGKTADGRFNKAQIGAAGIALTAYMVTQHNLGAADEDEDGESVYNDLSDYDHLMSWNMVLDDGKTFAQIPMPYGYGFFHTLGRLGAEYFNGNKDEGDVAAELTASFAHHMLPPPLGFVGSIGKVDDLDEFGALMLGNVAPSVSEPLVQYATNTNHFGSPLYLEDNPLIKPAAPDATRSKRSTSAMYRGIAEWMNEATGGSLYRSGAVDVSPDGMQFLQEYLLGGLGRFINRSADLAAKYNSPENEDITMSDIPIARYFFGEPSDYADKLDYYDYIDSATQVFKEAEELDGDARRDFVREFGGVVQLEPLYKETQKQLRKLRQRKKQIEKTQKDPIKAYDQIQKVEAEMQSLFDRFNKRYREATR